MVSQTFENLISKSLQLENLSELSLEEENLFYLIKYLSESDVVGDFNSKIRMKISKLESKNIRDFEENFVFEHFEKVIDLAYVEKSSMNIVAYIIWSVESLISQIDNFFEEMNFPNLKEPTVKRNINLKKKFHTFIERSKKSTRLQIDKNHSFQDCDYEERYQFFALYSKLSPQIQDITHFVEIS